MFQQLDLKNFRQHTELSITFQPGVVALRGRNEAGKTTILEAMAYAMFGATALREPLVDVVTWGKKESELKVKLDFALNGVEYRVTRSKSGAEIKTADKILATGQKEVTKYIESLLGASQDVCTKLMLASQEDIKGALSKGPSAAIELIEALSNLGVIDTIIGLVQEQLSCGTTTTVEARLGMLEQQVAQPVLDETGPFQTALDAATYDADNAQQAYGVEKAAYGTTLEAAETAQAALDAYEALRGDEGSATAASETAKAALARHVVPAPAETAKLDGLRKQLTDNQYMARAIEAATLLEGVKESENEWEGDYDSLLADLQTTRDKIKVNTQTVTALDKRIAALEAQKITQTACGLCGKDLSAIPEVVQKNTSLSEQVTVLWEQRDELTSGGETLATYLSGLVAIQTAYTENMRIYQRCGDFITLDHGFVPPRCVWAGPAELTAADPATIAADIRRIEAADRAYHSAVAVRDQLCQRIEETGKRVLAATVAREQAEAGLEVHQAALDASAAALLRLNDADATLKACQQAVQTARQALSGAQAVLRERQAARAALEKQLADARKELAEMADNNALIDFLRKARPQITDQLWGMVTTTVSSYFSDIRGVPSIVTRADNGFKVDGHNVAGLSGSTKDALGLAIRKALTKTFLPNASFMMLDEPASGCDEDRESNMLGLIAAGGFDQVLLITHSDLADSFATQVVQL